jgi:hypothetical protein
VVRVKLLTQTSSGVLQRKDPARERVGTLLVELTTRNPDCLARDVVLDEEQTDLFGQGQ